MKIIDELAEMARTRPQQLKAKKQQGLKLVGHTGRFVPEEIIRAAGATPYYLCRGGEPEAPEAVLPYMLRFMDPFSRAQIGYHLLGMDPVMPMLDLIIAQCEDCHMTRLADMLEYFKLPVIKLGVPPDWKKSIARDYYFKQLIKLKEKMEALTGCTITESRLKTAIETMNRMRRLLCGIGELRKKQKPALSGSTFLRLHHLTFYVDDATLLPMLEALYDTLEKASSPLTGDEPRLLLAGNVVACGDYMVPDLIERSGGQIVAEFMDRGHRYSHWPVSLQGDLMTNLCDCYYLNRVPPTVFQPAWEERQHYLDRLIEDYRIDGVIWYQLAFDEIHNMEYAVLSKELQKRKLPMLKLESAYEYTREAMGPLTTRIESFIASVKQRGGK